MFNKWADKSEASCLRWVAHPACRVHKTLACDWFWMKIFRKGKTNEIKTLPHEDRSPQFHTSVGGMKSFSLCSCLTQEISTTLPSTRQEAWLCICMWHGMSLALVLSPWLWVICPTAITHHHITSGSSEVLPCQGSCKLGGKSRPLQSQNSSTPAGISRQLDQPDIKLHGKIFGYVSSFSAANSFCKRPWDCSCGRVRLQSQAGDSHWSQNSRKKHPGKQG